MKSLLVIFIFICTYIYSSSYVKHKKIYPALKVQEQKQKTNKKYSKIW